MFSFKAYLGLRKQPCESRNICSTVKLWILGNVFLTAGRLGLVTSLFSSWVLGLDSWDTAGDPSGLLEPVETIERQDSQVQVLRLREYSRGSLTSHPVPLAGASLRAGRARTGRTTTAGSLESRLHGNPQVWVTVPTVGHIQTSHIQTELNFWQK